MIRHSRKFDIFGRTTTDDPRKSQWKKEGTRG